MSLLLYHNTHNKQCKSPEVVSHEGLKVTCNAFLSLWNAW